MYIMVEVLFKKKTKNFSLISEKSISSKMFFCFSLKKKRKKGLTIKAS